jgi:A/G-specific adenine glycosylase
MLQQTQVTTVLLRYGQWLQRFPSFAALAAASESEVLHAWQGLGYYARALNLHATARAVIHQHGGQFPTSHKAIRHLPGVGRYTANAVMTFAFNRPVPIIESNTARLLSRLIDLRTPIDSSRGREALWEAAGDLVPERNAGFYNSALIDLGALVCKSRPNCGVCPVSRLCRAKKPSELPIKKSRPQLQLGTERHAFSVKNDSVLLEQSRDRWRGMWILPRLTNFPAKRKPLHVSEFPFTNHRITLIVFSRRPSNLEQDSHRRWFTIDELATLPLPSPHRRALETLIRTSHRNLRPDHSDLTSSSAPQESKCEA